MSSDEVTLHRTPIASLPREAAASLALASSRSPMTTRAPCSANMRAIASPMPWAAPVITAVRPVSMMVLSWLFGPAGPLVVIGSVWVGSSGPALRCPG